MKRSRFSEEQIIAILRESEGAEPARQICANHNISEATFYAWKRKYGGMDVSEARRLRALEDENARMKRVIADLTVQNHILREVNAKNGKPSDQASGRAHVYRKRLGAILPQPAGRLVCLGRATTAHPESRKASNACSNGSSNSVMIILVTAIGASRRCCTERGKR